jgi:hypothetical protein
MNSKEKISLSWFQRKRYSGKFIAYSNNEIYASDNSFWDCRHKAREKLSGKVGIRKNLSYLYIEQKNNIFRGLLFVFLGFFIFESLMYDLLSSNQIASYKKAEIFIFYNSMILSIFLASLLIISPVVKSHNFFGSIGEAIGKKERQLGWEVALTGISIFIFLGTIIIELTTYIEFKIILDSIYISLSGILLILQFWFSLKEERKLKKLHYYLIDLITLEDRLSYSEIASYLSEIPEIKNKNISDTNSLLLTLEASLESPFSLARVIAFNILFRDLGITLGSIFVSFAIGYILYIDYIVENLIAARIFGSFLSAGLLLFYALVKRSTSSLFAESFVKTHAHFMLRPGGADRIYMKFFPDEVSKMKEKSILTILRQSVLLTTGLGVFFLLYGLELVALISFSRDYEFIEIMNSASLAFGMIPVFLFILYVARAGTKSWILSIESKMIELDQKLETQIGIGPNEILGYLHEAHSKYNEIFKNSVSDSD